MNFKRVLTVASLLLGVQAAQAGVVWFTDRSAWAAAAGAASFSEDFSGFASDTSFTTSAVALNGGSIQQVGSDNFRNFIDAPTLSFSDNNGTAHASAYTNFGAVTISLSFDALNGAFGFESWDAASGEGTQLDIFSGGSLLDSHALGGGNGAFLGYVLTGGSTATSVSFASRTNLFSGGEGFGLDNLVGVNAATSEVPEPGSLALLGLGLVGLAASRKRKQA